MQKKEFVQAVAERAGIEPEDISETMIRRAFSEGCLPPALRIAGWIDYRQEHIEAMVEFVRTRTRLTFSGRGSAELVEHGGQVHGVR